MRFAAGPPSRWRVELRDGTTVEVWADGFQREGDYYTFSSLFDLEADEDLPNDAVVLGETPSNARRFVLAVARLRKSAVQGDEDEPAIRS